MNRDPSLIPQLCEMQWQPYITHIICPVNCAITPPLLLDFTLHMTLLFPPHLIKFITCNLLLCGSFRCYGLPLLYVIPRHIPPLGRTGISGGFEQHQLDNVKHMLISSLVQVAVHCLYTQR